MSPSQSEQEKNVSKNTLDGSEIRAGRDFSIGDTTNVYHLGPLSYLLIIAFLACLALTLYLANSLFIQPEQELIQSDLVDKNTPKDLAGKPDEKLEIQPVNVQKEPSKTSPPVISQVKKLSMTISGEPELIQVLDRLYRSRITALGWQLVENKHKADLFLHGELLVELTPLEIGSSGTSVIFQLSTSLQNKADGAIIQYLTSPPSSIYYLQSSPQQLRAALQTWLNETTPLAALTAT